jgi:predicted MFS family arabinose efflux permease
VAGMISNPLLGLLVDAWSKGKARERFMACAVLTTLGLPGLLFVGIGRHASVFLVGLLLLGFVMASFDVSWLPMLCTVTANNQRATAWGLCNLGATLGGGAAALLTGLIMRRVGLGAVMASLAPLFLLISALLVFAGFKFLSRDLRREAVR